MAVPGRSSEQNGVADQLLLAAAVVVDVKEDLVLGSIAKMLGDDARQPARVVPCTIYKVRDKIRKEDPGAYDPQIVSIGPFHRGNPQLLPMERIKRQFLQMLIDRHPSNTLNNYIKVVSSPAFVEEMNKCYSEQVVGADGGNAFVETMVLDGCFIIEFLARSLLGESMGELDFVNWNRSLVENDLLLIENQLPFYVLEVLYNSSFISGLHDDNPPISMTELAACYMARERSDSPQPVPEIVHHLLHLRHSSLRPTPVQTLQDIAVKSCSFWSTTRLMVTRMKLVLWYSFFWVLSCILTCRRPPADEESQRAPRMTPSATELDEAGIKFELRKKASCILDVSFRANEGVMEIPLLSVQAVSVSKFRNLVAFEQCCPAAGSQFTSYVALMDNLIDTPADVALLQNSGVLESKLGGNEEVARFFNSLGKGAYLDYEKHYLVKLFKDVKDYCAKERHRWRARMVHDYFGNPWSIVSLIAAFVLLLLTVTQTFFAVFSYFRPP